MAFFRKAFLVNSSAFVCFIIRLAQTVILTRVLGPAGIGQYALVTSALMLTTQISALGLPLAFLYYSQHEPNKARVYQINCIWSSLVMGLIGGAGIGLLVSRYNSYFGDIPLFGAVAVGLYCVFMIQGGVMRNSIMRKLQSKRLSAITLSSVLGSIILVVILASFKLLTVATALICFMFMQMIRMIMGWYWSHTDIDFTIRPDFKIIRKLGVMGLRLGLVDVMVLLNSSINIMIIKWLITDFNSLGFFSRAMQIAMLVVTASQAVLPLLFSRWASLPANELRPHFEKVMRMVTSFSMILIIFILLSAHWVILGLYGRDFLPAAGPMMILLPGTVMYLLAKVVIQFLSSRGMPGICTVILGISAFINALLSYILISNWGIHGAAMASTCANLVLVILLLIIVVRRFGVNLMHCILLTNSDCKLMFSQLRR